MSYLTWVLASEFRSSERAAFLLTTRTIFLFMEMSKSKGHCTGDWGVNTGLTEEAVSFSPICVIGNQGVCHGSTG